jgi:ribosomal protein L21E
LAETENNDFVPDAAVNRKGNKNDDCLQSEIESNLPISSPASPANPSPVQDTSPTQVPHKSHTSPTVGSKHKEFEVGDRVVIVEHGSIHHGQKGKVADIWHSSSETDYTIALDKESHFSKVVVVSVPKVSKFPFLMAVNS